LTAYGTWVSYSGAARIWLAILLLAVAGGLTYTGTRLRLPLRARRPGKAAAVFMLVAWVLAIATFLICTVVYVEQARQDYPIGTPPTDPITIVTLAAVVATFAIVNEMGQPLGQRAALGSAVIGALSAPMIFELPFDLIVMARTYPLDPSSPGVVPGALLPSAVHHRDHYSRTAHPVAHGGVVQEDSSCLGCDVRRLRDLGSVRVRIPVCPDHHRAERAVEGPGVRRRRYSVCARGIRCRQPARQGAWGGRHADLAGLPTGRPRVARATGAGPERPAFGPGVRRNRQPAQ
jgi:hypothetical protein